QLPAQQPGSQRAKAHGAPPTHSESRVQAPAAATRPTKTTSHDGSAKAGAEHAAARPDTRQRPAAWGSKRSLPAAMLSAARRVSKLLGSSIRRQVASSGKWLHLSAQAHSASSAA